MARRKKVEKHQVPEQLLNQVNENFAFGWILFGFDIDQNMQIFSNFDDQNSYKAMKNDIGKWINAMEQIEGQMVFQSILENNS